MYCGKLHFQSPIKKVIKKEEELEEEPPEKEELDWWSKYYASLAELEKQVINCFDNRLYKLRVLLIFSTCTWLLSPSLLQEEKEDDLEDGQDGGTMSASRI